MSNITNLNDIAGYCPEEAIWKFLVDMSTTLIEENRFYKLCPRNILVDGESFLLVSNQEQETEFVAPDQKIDAKPSHEQMVWTIGALIYYLSTGRIIYGGHGGRYQREHPQAPLPTLPKAHLSLTPVMQNCLCTKPSNRISIKELNGIAQKGIINCLHSQREKRFVDTNNNYINITKVEIWPEKMKEI